MDNFTADKRPLWRLLARSRWIWIAALTVVIGMAGCSGFAPDAKPTTGRNPAVAEVPDKDETVRGEEEPAIVTLDIGESLHERKLASGDKLPGNIIIPTTNLEAVPVTAALQAVLSGTDVSLSWDSGTFDDHLVTVMNMSGPLPLVVQKICSGAKVFCSYRHGSLELKDKETFIVPLPPISKASSLGGLSSAGGGGAGAGAGSPGGATSSSAGGTPGAASVESVSSAAGNTMADAISDLSNDKARIDVQGGNIIYTTDTEGEDRVREYLEELRNGRPLVVLQLYIWEVTLNKENSEGINWQHLQFPKIGGHFESLDLSAPASSISAATTDAVTFGAVTAGKVSASLLASFLSTQGRTQTISNPQITFVSGSSAQFMVGGQTTYVSSVGQLVSATNGISGTTTGSGAAGVGTNTISTSSISTGLSIGVSGAYDNGVVFANLNLSLTNLVGGTVPTTTEDGETIGLPVTVNRQVSTIIRVRPGDNLVMAGMVTSNDSNTRQGLPLPGDARLPMYGDDNLANNELVVMVKPSVVLFADKSSSEEARKREEAAKPLPAALVIDKDGTKSMAMPGSVPAAPMPATTAVAIKPESAVSESVVVQPSAAPVQFVPDTGNDNAPVDQHLMQRGFSHAFDQLLQPSSSAASAADASPPGGDSP